MPDKFSAVWVSHSSMSEFLKCPRAYYLKNVYKDPATNHKIQITSPALALGSAVHEVIESLSIIPTKERFKESLLEKFEKSWKKVIGKKGGFSSPEQEQKYKQRGEAMLRRVMNHPGPVANLAVKIKEDLPWYWLSESDGIILCGKVDWIEYLPDSDSVHIIDFKTSKGKEDGNSLQLPIYHLLVHNTQQRKVSKASYWYLEMSEELEEKELPDLEVARQQVLEVAKKIKLARQLNVFKCPQGGECFACKDMERILRGEGEKIGLNDFGQDVYILPHPVDIEKESEIL
jgi:ATP-dependent helicase/DNAse subunit B